MRISGKLKITIAVIFFLVSQVLVGCTTQRGFAQPDEAVSSLISSLRADDRKQLMDILGPEADDLLLSGDPNVDKDTVNRFLTAYDQKHRLNDNDDGSLTLCVGDQDWPLPIPLVQRDKDDQWVFDTAAGKDEILNRRVGRDELDTIQTCLAIVDAQREYAQTDPENVGVPIYAQKFLSDPGRKNGLYWPTGKDEPQSPLGDLVGTAQSQGYSVSKSTPDTPQPYHGYYYRMLLEQGPDSPGGAREYVIKGKMIAGFGVIATPATYGNTGIMTFIVNYDGIVYQRDLGKDTAKLAAKITAFNPDSNWKKIASADEESSVTQAPQ